MSHCCKVHTLMLARKTGDNIKDVRANVWMVQCTSLLAQRWTLTPQYRSQDLILIWYS